MPAKPSISELAALEETAKAVEGQVHSDYSGRSMYGRLCYSIYCDSDIACIEEAASRGLKGAKVDNMGRGFVVYWPSLTGQPE